MSPGTSKVDFNISVSKQFEPLELLELYKLNQWSSAKKPDLLIKAIKNSDTVVLARYNGKLIGMGNAISDGYLVVYYSHLLVHPKFQNMGIGTMIMKEFQKKYNGFHQQMIVADGNSVEFYEKCGYIRAGNTESMWIYQGDEH